MELKQYMKRTLKPKQCKACGAEFMPRTSTQVACSPSCAFKLVETKKEANAEKQAIVLKRNTERLIKAQRKADAEKKEALKSRREVLNDAQKVFNKFIRMRDENKPCISCGRENATWDAGHYRSVGAAPQLRFNEDNCHKQCVQCNQHKSGNAVEYRIGLVTRIGADRVEALECNNQPVKWSADEARQIKAHYQNEIKRLKVQGTINKQEIT